MITTTHDKYLEYATMNDRPIKQQISALHTAHYYHLAVHNCMKYSLCLILRFLLGIYRVHQSLQEAILPMPDLVGTPIPV